MKEFLKKHSACEEGFKWAVKNCKTMQEVWDTVKPEWLTWLATRPGVLTDRELYEFALWSAQQVEHLMEDERSKNALLIRRKWLDGEASNEEMNAAKSAARDATGSATGSATWSAPLEWSVADSAARLSAGSAAWATESAAGSAWSAAVSAAVSVRLAELAVESAREAEKLARSSQADWLRGNTKPNFERSAEDAKQDTKL